MVDFKGDRILFLDTETTGLEADPHRIIEIGIVESIDGEMTNNNFQVYLNPPVEIEEEALATHGITKEFLKNKKQFIDCVDSLLSFISDARAVIIHNAIFDVSFLNFELELINMPPIDFFCRSIKDSLFIARAIHPNTSVSLESLCRQYKIDDSKRIKHGALLDAYLTFQVFYKMLAENPTHSVVQSFYFDLQNQIKPIQYDNEALHCKKYQNTDAEKEDHNKVLMFLGFIKHLEQKE
jgi:DNA polymerase-3 subunit epsilon